MKRPDRTVVITGATGYLGTRISQAFAADGWQVLSLVRNPQPASNRAERYDLSLAISESARHLLKSADVLVHASYDLSLTKPADIWRVNVDGTRTLLDVATDAGVPRILVLSSMSAYTGTTQLYGRAKLEIEDMTVRAGGVAIRPGLVYGNVSGGMAGALRKLTKLPLVPVITGVLQYTTRETDLTDVVLALGAAESLPPQVIPVAHPVPVPLRELLAALAAEDHRRCRFLPVPWQPLYAALRVGEALRVHMPFRADSLLGLVRPAPSPQESASLRSLGLDLRAFSPMSPARG